MDDNKLAQPVKVGDRVGIRYWPKLRARIVEERGPLGPGGALVYRIRIAGKPKPSYVEVPEDQLFPMPPPNGHPAPGDQQRAEGESGGA